jgi:hypothetical protein
MNQIVYLVDPVIVSDNEVKFKFKMPQLPSDRPDTMFIELLQLQFDINTTSGDVLQDGVDIRLMNQGSNYVSTDNNGICLGLISWLRTSLTNQDFGYISNSNTYKVLVNSHQDWLEFHLYDIDNDIVTGAIYRCKMIIQITYPETPKQISNEYRKQIPLPSRLL